MNVRFFLPLLLILLGAARIEPPVLTPSDVHKKMGDILESHAIYSELTPELMGRALSNFADQLDPAKTYLSRDQIAWALEPSEELTEELLAAYQSGDFSTFAQLYDEMDRAILWRTQVEQQIDLSELPTDISNDEFHDADWAETRLELEERLLRLRALQAKVAATIDPDEVDRALGRIAKRRTRREENHFGLEAEQRDHQIRAFVLKALANALDAQTIYFTPHEAESFLVQLQQRLYGIGVQLREGLDGFTIVQVIEGGPTDLQGGILANDRVIAVDGETVIGMDIEDFVRLVRGESGSLVHLTLLRGEEQFEVDIIRGEVVFKETRIEAKAIPFGDGTIAHIALHTFYQDERFSSGSDLKEELERLKATHNLKGVVLDLRSNSGGLLSQAVEVAGLFISKGIVASIKGSRDQIHYLRDIDGETSWDGPLIVLVNKISASAAEIVAQSLQDYGRAIVVGDETTFGKGTYQTPTIDITGERGLDPTGEYKVTRGMYYTVSGKSPQLSGVLPDVVVPGPLSQLEIGERFSKFPLDGGEIASNFHDDLSDVPLLHRPGIRKSYHFDLQPRLKSYNRFLDQLRLNSEQRIDCNDNYQSMLERLQEKEWNDSEPKFGLNDLQLEESIEIMRDLVHLVATQGVNHP